jgi:hypothetical protein
VVIKNFWSLSVDEAIVADKIRETLGKDYEVFFPVNSQLKDIDLVIFNLKNRKAKTVQVKGSRTYEWDADEYHSWHQVKKETIFAPRNKADFFIFIFHVPTGTKTTRTMVPVSIVVPANELKKIVLKKKLVNKNTYHFSFYTDRKKYAADSRDPQNEINFSKYLDNFELLKH